MVATYFGSLILIAIGINVWDSSTFVGFVLVGCGMVLNFVAYNEVIQRFMSMRHIAQYNMETIKDHLQGIEQITIQAKDIDDAKKQLNEQLEQIALNKKGNRP